MGVVAAIWKQFICVRKSIEQTACAFVITGLAGGQEQQQGPAEAVRDSMKFGVQATFHSSDTAGNNPFLSDWLRCDAL